MSKFDSVWRSLDKTVAARWAPGIVAGVRHNGATEFYATGLCSYDAPAVMQTNTAFRIASLSKPLAGALTALMISDGVFALDDSVERWLPELSNQKVLTHPHADLDQTVATDRPITIRHLLTMTNGIGAFFTKTPLAVAMQSAGLAPSPIPPQMSADEFISAIAALPLAYQPGEHWMYHTASDILSVLLSRAASKSLGELLKEKITGPLNMHATSFASANTIMASAYRPTPRGIVAFDEYNEAFAQAPEFESLGGGLVSTVPDYLAFLSALADDTLLPTEMRVQMTSDQLSAEQKAGITEMMGPTKTWGWQLAIELAVSEPWTAPGRYGWTGGSGTSAVVDPSRDLIGVVFTQRLMSGPNENFSYFWEPLVAAV